MLAMLLAAALVAAAPLSPEAKAVIAPVFEAIAEVRAKQAALPPPKDDAERLVRMGELDQAPRRAITAIDFSRIPAAERSAATAEAGAAIEAVDDENQAALLRMVPPERWFLRSRYGDRAASAAFHIVQHSDADLWRRFLPVLEPLVATGEVPGQSYGLMFDRLAINEGRPQRYGSQFRCDDGRWRPYPIEPGDVEARRRAMGFPGTFAQMQQRFATMPPCPQTQSAPPPAMRR